MKKETIIAILATVLSVIVILIIVGLALPEETTQQEFGQETQQLLRDGFIEGCMSEDATFQECSCAFDAITKEYTLTEIIGFNDYIPQKALDTVEHCWEY